MCVLFFKIEVIKLNKDYLSAFIYIVHLAIYIDNVEFPTSSLKNP
jgi:hypothetical protein